MNVPGLVVAFALPCVGAVAVSDSRMHEADCALYDEAITIAADSQNVVVIDSTVLGTPMFAFFATSGFSKKPEEQGLPLFDSTLQALKLANAHRESLRQCLSHGPRSTISDDSISAIFADTGGWRRFRARYPDAKGFVLVSRPLVMADSAFIYVALASDWLAGAGSIILFRKEPSGRWVRKGQAFLWLS